MDFERSCSDSRVAAGKTAVSFRALANHLFAPPTCRVAARSFQESLCLPSLSKVRRRRTFVRVEWRRSRRWANAMKITNCMCGIRTIPRTSSSRGLPPINSGPYGPGDQDDRKRWYRRSEMPNVRYVASVPCVCTPPLQSLIHMACSILFTTLQTCS